jgi:hypothetical protein
MSSPLILQYNDDEVGWNVIHEPATTEVENHGHVDYSVELEFGIPTGWSTNGPRSDQAFDDEEKGRRNSFIYFRLG